MNQTWENDKIPKNFGPNLLCLAKIWVPKPFLWVLILLVVKHGKKPTSRHNFSLFWSKFAPPPPQFFSWVLPQLDVIHCCKLSLYIISRKTNELNLTNCKKPIFGPILAHLAQICSTKIFLSKIWLHQSLDIMTSYHHVQ